jgi:hypothetical protein
MVRLTDGTQVDCAASPGRCELVVQSFGGSNAVATLEFDPAAPVPPPPVIAVTPGGPLPYRAALIVTGSGFVPNLPVRLQQCEAAALACGAGSGAADSVVADPNGAFTARLDVVRSLRSFETFPPSTVDCGTAAGACVVRAVTVDEDDGAESPLDFDPSAPLPAVSATIAPSTSLADFQIVEVHGSGFFPGDEVIVQQCSPGAQTVIFPFGCTSQFTTFVGVAPDGTFATSTRVRRSFVTIAPGGGGAQELHCADAPGTCVLAVASVIDPNASAEVALTFRADPDPVASPIIAIDEPGPYDDGQRVTVRGTGYLPGASLAIVQCSGEVNPDGAGCGYAGTASSTTADAHGTVVVQTTLLRRVRGIFGGGDVDCGVGTPTCRLVVAEIAGRSSATSGALPLVFRDPAQAPAAAPDPDAVAGERVARVARALALTGVDPRGVAAVGLTAVAAGILLLVVAGRRGRRATPAGR